jgi:glycerol uptake facilitator-like aquaporin
MGSPDIVRLSDVVPRAGVFTVWERHRHTKVHWLVECFAEFMGVFFYVYAGVGSTAPFVLGAIIDEPGLSSVLQIGFAYAAGIVFAIAICSATSGGHFNPCVSIAFVVFKGFPPLKAARYIVFQILGAYIACLLIYVQYKDLISTVELALTAAGKLDAIQFTPQGPAGIFGLYANPAFNLGRIFLNEFVVDTFLAMVIWGCLDPTNILVPPSLLPITIAMAYAVAIWGFATVGLSANSARDVGGRLAAMSIWGSKASGGKYAAIAALTNIPATLFGAFLYEIFLTDSDRVMPRAQREWLEVHQNHGRAPGVVNHNHHRDAESASTNSKQRTSHD